MEAPFERDTSVYDGPADLVFSNANIVDVVSGDIRQGDIAVYQGKVVGVYGTYKGNETVDCTGKYVAPGFIDGHIHIESSMLGVREFSRAVLPHGTTAVVTDPHEIANVLGTYGVDLMIKESGYTPLNVYVTAPSCVPATHLETSGAVLGPSEIETLMGYDSVVGLGEVMNFPGVIGRDPQVMAKLAAAQRAGKVIDGHAPMVSGDDLDAYIAAGVQSDHECSNGTEALEKLGKGMHLMVREGSAARDMANILPDLIAAGADMDHVSMVSDDRHPGDLLEKGHLDYTLREAVRLGLDPVTAIKTVTYNTAKYFKLDDIGSIEPGKRADLVVFSSLEDFTVNDVYVAGERVAHNGTCTAQLGDVRYQDRELRSVHLSKTFDANDFAIPYAGDEGQARVIGVTDGSLLTSKESYSVTPENGKVGVDTARDLLKISVVERHHGTNDHTTALVHGFGLTEGAIASTVAHDSHNIVVVGADEQDMATAVNYLGEHGGGLVVVRDGKVVDALDLEIAGLMSTKDARYVADTLDRLHEEVRDQGCSLEAPFMTMAFLALPVIPELKISDQGLIEDFQIVPVVEDGQD